mgnify:CR=1 FL=1
MKTISAENVIKAFKLEGKEFAVLDFETSSSRDGNVGRPIQLGALQYDENHVLTEISKYVNQGDYNPETDMIQTKDKFFSITDLTGVTKDHLQSKEFEEQRITECELVHFGFTDGLIIGYNIAYDVRTLKEAYKRCQLPFTSIQLVDVMGIFLDIYGAIPGYIKYGYNRSMQKPHYEKYKLNDCAHKLGVVSASDEQEHDALSDVQWTLAVLNKIIEEYPGLDYTRYINKIYYNPCYEIPEWQRLSQEGVSYYPFGTKEKLARVFDQFTLYNYNNFNESDW